MANHETYLNLVPSNMIFASLLFLLEYEELKMASFKMKFGYDEEAQKIVC